MQRGNYSTTIEFPPRCQGETTSSSPTPSAMDSTADSWSDPDVTVYSESGLQLTGPGELAVDVPAVFTSAGSWTTPAAAPRIFPSRCPLRGRLCRCSSPGPQGNSALLTYLQKPGGTRWRWSSRGADLLLGSSVRLEVTAVMPTVLAISPISQVKVGGVLQWRAPC